MATVISIYLDKMFCPLAYFTFSDSTESAALVSITHLVITLWWIKSAYMEQMKLFLNTLRFTAEQRQGAMKAGRIDDTNHMIDSKTPNFFTSMADADTDTITEKYSHIPRLNCRIYHTWTTTIKI